MFKFNIQGFIVSEATETCTLQPQKTYCACDREMDTGGQALRRDVSLGCIRLNTDPAALRPSKSQQQVKLTATPCIQKAL